MQAHAIFEAAAEVQKSGTKVHPEVMIPLVGFKRELELQVEIVRRVAQDVQDALLDTNGRWPLCRACDVLEPHALYVHPDLGGPDPTWVCEHAGIAVAPIGEL